ncbi:SDR family NAD(P)-dependent oxidoreductase [Streptomyces varsoviensis]|uniref:SDR family NAD(P)-dependent oxidoreductase n=1 Tax=Streptomyces varsoviensis TaxID=67373 RepID=UPI0004C5D4D2|nr:SDR family oxidoreductase [Streptomyces varsoviensis]
MPSRANTAVVTGGSDGLGYAIADALASKGADLILVGRDPHRLGRARRTLLAHGAAVHTVPADLAEPGAVAAVGEAVRALTDRVDTLVNNVGAAHFAPLADTTPEMVDAMLHLNVKVPLLLSRALLAELTRAQGGIINISSYWARKMTAGRASAAYSATRGAVNSLTMALANELGPAGVRVNALAPGAVHTSTYQHSYLDPMTPPQRAAHDAGIQDAYPLGRIGAPRDVAEAAAYLAEARWTTGTVLTVDGGLTVR